MKNLSLTNFLEAFFPDENETIWLRAFKAKDAPDTKDNTPMSFPITRAKLQNDKALQDRLKKANMQRGIYFVVNAGGNSDGEIKRFSAFFVENDRLPIDEQHKRLNEAPLLPSIRVETKKSIHAYWLFKDNCEPDEWRGIQKRLIEYFDGDKSIHNPSRVMRLPFFNHVSFDGKIFSYKRVVVKEFEPTRIYDLETIKRAFLLPERLNSSQSSSLQEKHTTSEVRSENSIIPEYERNATLASLAGTMRRRGMTYAAILAALKAENTERCKPPINESEVILIANSISRYPINSSEKETNQLAEVSDNEPKIKLPELSRGALHGLAGDFVRAVFPHTEAHETALLLQFLAVFGNIAGKSAHIITDGSKQYLNLFLLLIGKTGKQSRKGTALAHVLNLFEAVDEDWTKKRILNGLASGQGLIHAIRDPKFKIDKDGNRIIKDGEEVCLDVGESDKRILCVEEEFAAVLKMQGIDNSTLSAVLRSAWDGKPLGNLSRQNNERCLNPHVSLIGHITPDEFSKLLNEVELSNGYLNRFYLSYVWRSKTLPEGGVIPQNEFNDLIIRTRNALEFAQNVQEMKRDKSAQDLWRDAYYKFNEQISIGLIGDVLSRAEPQVTRLSMLFAVLDKSDVIRREHLEAALEVWRCCEDAAAFIFRGRVGDKSADKILDALGSAYPDGLTQSSLYELFDRHIKKAVLESKLIMLLEAGLVRSETQETNTRQATIWFTQKPRK